MTYQKSKWLMHSIFYTVILLFAFSILILPSIVSAHIPGQPAFFKVDGTYANFYNVPSTSLSDFILPQDQAPRSYLVGERIDFEIDIVRLGVPPDAAQKIKYTWDYGDSSKAEGRTTNHLYKKMGTYILTVHADDGQAPTPQLLESVAINIIPDKNYKLPKAVFTVNGITSKDPLVDTLKLDLNQELTFDGSSSQGELTSYFWDFGDHQSANGKVQSHRVKLDSTMIFPLLRVKDKNGFFSDTYVQVNNTPGQTGKKSSLSTSQTVSSSSSPLFLYGGGGVIIGITIFFLLRKRKK